MILIKLIAASYFYVGMPLLLGMTWNKIKKESNPRIAPTFADGYLIWFAFFFVGTFFEYRQFYKFSYWKMTRVWTLGLAVLTVACLVLLNKTIIERIAYRAKRFGKIFKEYSQAKEILKQLARRYGHIVAAFVLAMASILFVNPLSNDDLIERGNLMISTDGFSFPETFYTVPAGIFKLSLASCVHVDAAFGLLLFFFAAYRTIALTLYKDEKRRSVFLAIVIIFYLCMTIANVHLSVGVFQNIWNPLTLTVSCLFPLMLIKTTELGMYKRAGVRLNKKNAACALFMVICATAAAQLFVTYGAGLCSVLFVLGMILV